MKTPVEGTPIYCAWISKDNIAMWPSGAAYVPDKAWHAGGKQKKPGFYTVEIIQHDIPYVWRVMSLNRSMVK
jgi:hypothetical protein